MSQITSTINQYACRFYYWVTHATVGEIVSWAGIAVLLVGMLFLMGVVVGMCFGLIK